MSRGISKTQPSPEHRPTDLTTEDEHLLRALFTECSAEEFKDRLEKLLQKHFDSAHDSSIECLEWILKQCLEAATIKNREIYILIAIADKITSFPAINPERLTIAHNTFSSLLTTVETNGNDYLVTAAAWSDESPFPYMPTELFRKTKETTERILERKNFYAKQDGIIPTACPTFQPMPVNSILTRDTESNPVKCQVEAIQTAAEKYITWMNKEKITGTRFFTRWHHFHHGDTGRKRVQAILDAIKTGTMSVSDLKKITVTAFRNSSRAEHSFSQFLYKELTKNSEKSRKYETYVKEFNAEIAKEREEGYVDDCDNEEPLSQYIFLKDQANADLDSMDLFLLEKPKTEKLAAHEEEKIQTARLT